MVRRCERRLGHPLHSVALVDGLPKRKTLPDPQEKEALDRRGGGKTAPPLNYILAEMKKKCNVLDYGTAGVFLVWLISTDFENFSWHSVAALLVISAYIVYRIVKKK